MQLYVKYNGVLRGLNSDSAFLKGTMVRLCCPKEVSDKYTAGVITFEPHRHCHLCNLSLQNWALCSLSLHNLSTCHLRTLVLRNFATCHFIRWYFVPFLTRLDDNM